MTVTIVKDEEKKLDGGIKAEEIWVNKFDEASAVLFRTAVMKQVHEDPSKPLIIYIDSYGGYVDSLAKMIETLDEVSTRFGTIIMTVCMGKAMSCGAILLSHGDIRYCGPHSRVMVHEVSSAAFGDVHDIANDAQETKRLNEHFLGLLARNCSISGGYKGLRKIVKDRDGRDIWLDAKGSLAFGIVDYIGIPKINQLVQFESVIPSGPSRQDKRSQLVPIKQKDTEKKRAKSSTANKAGKPRATKKRK